jgi:hypothetical protein
MSATDPTPLAQRLQNIAEALIHEAAIAARPGQLDRLEAIAADLREIANGGLPEQVVDTAWHEYRYPRPALDERGPAFLRAMAVVSAWIGGADRA